jgi:polysaccharide export outer membrane protein
VKERLRRGLCLASLLALTACTAMPRGAAIEREVLQDVSDEPATFQVVEVTRDTTRALRDWPSTGWHGHHHWIETSRGPASPLIRTGDTVDITIWDNQENSLITGLNDNTITMAGLAVSASGSVFVPYVDEVVIRGMTPDEARREVQTRLAPIAPDAQVQLAVASGAQNSVSFVSGVNSPWAYPLPDRNTTILAGIALAGGISSALRNPSVSLIRGDHTYSIPAEALYASARKNTRLQGGDKVIVQEDTRSFTALGASGVENLVYFPKERVTALEAVSLMGGIDARRADPRGILILREFPANALHKTALGPTHEEVVFAIDLTSADGLFAARNFEVNPDDTVLATESQITGLSTLLTLVGQTFGLKTSITAVAE